MKGLILKDFYVAVKQCRSIFAVVLLFLVISFIDEGSNFFIMFYPCILVGVMPMNLMAFDEQYKWNVYSFALPYTRAQLVSSKYIFGFLMDAVIVALLSIVQAYKMINAESFAASSYCFMVVTMITLCFISTAVLLPVLFKFGVAKGRIVNFILIGALCGGSTFLVNMDSSLLLNFPKNVPMAFFGIGAFIIFAVSWLISLFIYKVREIS